MRPWLLAALVAGAAILGATVPHAPVGDGDWSRAADSAATTRSNDTDGTVSSGSRRCPLAAAHAGDRSRRDPERATDRPVDSPRIVELYPDPTTYGNVGEFVTVSVPAETNVSGWYVTDGHASAALPNGTVSGPIAFTESPAETRRMTDHPVVELEGSFRPAADGDELELRDGDRRIDAVAYDSAPTGEVWYRSGRDEPASGPGAEAAPATGEWWPRGATCLPVTSAAVDAATAFVLPDSPEVALETIRAADDRVRLAGYTFTSEAVAAELRRAAARGVDVELLLESGPVGGIPASTAAALEDLRSGEGAVTVRVLGGEGARYAYHHAKYAVVDDRAIVTTENWKPSGVGGAGNRGWGVVVDDPAVAADLAAVFAADFRGRDTTSWARFRENASFVDEDPTDGAFSGPIGPETVGVDSVELLLAPDNAESRVRELLRGARESIRIEQVRIGDRQHPLLVETIAAARRGVEVRILLDSAWYVEDDNRALADSLERTAAEEGLPLEVALVEPRGRFEKIHAKGVVVDEEAALVGSANWNNNSFRDNREVALLLHGDEVGAYYADAFDRDWGERSWPLPAGLVAAVAVALAVAGLVGRRYVSFGEASAGVGPPTERGGP